MKSCKKLKEFCKEFSFMTGIFKGALSEGKKKK
jgi:hypothetical protein